LNLLGDNRDTINENSNTLIDASKEVCIKVNVDKTKYMLVSWQHNGQNQAMKLANRSSETVLQFKYLVTNQNII
jgi:hypothetical protein